MAFTSRRALGWTCGGLIVIAFPVASFPTALGSPLPGQLLFYVAATAPALALAWVSWHSYERQWLRLTRYFPYEHQRRR